MTYKNFDNLVGIDMGKRDPVAFIDGKILKVGSMTIADIDAAVHRVNYNGGKCGKINCGCYEEPLKILARKKLKDQLK